MLLEECFHNGPMLTLTVLFVSFWSLRGSIYIFFWVPLKKETCKLACTCLFNMQNVCVCLPKAPHFLSCSPWSLQLAPPSSSV